MVRYLAAAIVGMVGAVVLQPVQGGDWPWWRGPLRNGVAEGKQEVVTKWGER